MRGISLKRPMKQRRKIRTMMKIQGMDRRTQTKRMMSLYAGEQDNVDT